MAAVRTLLGLVVAVVTMAGLTTAQSRCGLREYSEVCMVFIKIT